MTARGHAAISAFGIVGAPLVFLASLSAAYALVPWACRTQQGAWVDAVCALALLVTAGSAIAAMAAHKRASRAEDSPTAARDVFLLRLALLSAAISTLAVLGQWAARLALSPCVA